MFLNTSALLPEKTLEAVCWATPKLYLFSAKINTFTGIQVDA